MIAHTVPITRVLVRYLTFSLYYVFGRVALATHFASHSQLIHSLFKAIARPKSCICSSVRSHRCGGCEESISGIGLCNASSYSACIWLKATGQERLYCMDIGDSTAPIDIVDVPGKESSILAALLALCNIIETK